MIKTVSIRHCEEYKEEYVQPALVSVLEDIGGLKSIVKKGMTVMLKPNLLAKCEPNQAVTTHPMIIELLSKMIISLGAKVIVADSPAIKYDVKGLRDIYDTTGMTNACHESGATLNYNIGSYHVDNAEGERLKQIELIDVINEADIIINVCKMKTHSLTGYSGCVKNLYGLIPGLIKAQTHSLFPVLRDFTNALIDLERIVQDKVVLHIVDAVVGMEGPGPRAGTPRLIGKLIASTNPYAADAAIVEMMNLEATQSPLLAEAVRRGLLDAEQPYEIIGESMENSIIVDYKSIYVAHDSNANVVPKYLQKAFRNLCQKRVVIQPDRCKGCGKCAEHCPTHAIRMEYDKKGELYAKIDYTKCINCFCCQELCPFKVVDIKTPVGHKIIQNQQKKRDKIAKKNNTENK